MSWAAQMADAAVTITGHQAVEYYQWREEQLSRALAQALSPHERDKILAQFDLQFNRDFCIRCIDALFFVTAAIAIILGSFFWATRQGSLAEMHTIGGIVLFALLGVCGCWFIGRKYNLMGLTSFVGCT